MIQEIEPRAPREEARTNIGRPFQILVSEICVSQGQFFACEGIPEVETS